jgi:hypothetical protein
MSGHSDMPPEFFDADEPDNPMTQEEFNAISADLGTPADWDRREADALDATGDWGDMLRAAELRTHADLMDEAKANGEAELKLARFREGQRKGAHGMVKRKVSEDAAARAEMRKVLTEMNYAFPLQYGQTKEAAVKEARSRGIGRDRARAAFDAIEAEASLLHKK